MRIRIIFIALCLNLYHVHAQLREVAITIDDVPNATIYKRDGFSSTLLKRIDSLHIPVAIFINEKNVFSNTSKEENYQGLKTWLEDENITAGNHSYSHMNYGDTSIMAFQDDITKGETLTRTILNRAVVYFRFPFNNLGNDSSAHKAIRRFLTDRGYVVAPFTIESEDWVFDNFYEEALKKNDKAKAREIGNEYVAHTLSLFAFFESVSIAWYGKNIKHIYLCHDNQLNTDFLPELIARLHQQGYTFISLEESLRDELYKMSESYQGKFGFSWIYRWQPDQTKRSSMMKLEPINTLLH